jgi:hypothetical protein
MGYGLWPMGYGYGPWAMQKNKDSQTARILDGKKSPDFMVGARRAFRRLTRLNRANGRRFHLPANEGALDRGAV